MKYFLVVFSFWLAMNNLAFAEGLRDGGIHGVTVSTIGAQPLDAGLTSISGLTLTPGDLIYATAADTYAVLAAGATTEILVGGGTAVPVWTTATGTGAPVRANTPTLITPDIGAATGTSLGLSGDLEITTVSAPSVILHNSTDEDIEGGRESQINFKGEQSGGEETTLARIQASHDGTSDDQKGDLLFYVNSGTDGDSPSIAMKIDSAGQVGLGTAGPYAALSIYKNQNAATQFIIYNMDVGNAAFSSISQNNGTYSAGFSLNGIGVAESAYNRPSGALFSTSGPGFDFAASDASGDIRFWTGGSNERMRIDSGGTVSIAGGALVEGFTVTVDNTDGVDTYTATQLLGKLIRRGTGDEITAARIDVTDTAANIVAVIPNCQVGSGFEFTINNEDSTHTIQVDGGTGITMSPNDPSSAIPANSSGRFLVEVTNATASSEAVTVHALGFTAH